MLSEKGLNKKKNWIQRCICVHPALPKKLHLNVQRVGFVYKHRARILPMSWGERFAAYAVNFVYLPSWMHSRHSVSAITVLKIFWESKRRNTKAKIPKIKFCLCANFIIFERLISCFFFSTLAMKELVGSG